MGGILFVLGICFLGVGFVAGNYENMSRSERERIALIEYENIDKYNNQRGRAHRILEELEMMKSYEYSLHGYDVPKMLALIEEDLEDGLIDTKGGYGYLDAKEIAAEAILYRTMLESGEEYLFPNKQYVGARFGVYTSEELKKEKSEEQLAMDFKTNDVEEAKAFQEKYNYLIRYYLAPEEYGGCIYRNKRSMNAQFAYADITHAAFNAIQNDPKFIQTWFKIEDYESCGAEIVVEHAFVYFVLGFTGSKNAKEITDLINRDYNNVDVLIRNCKFDFKCPLVGYKYSINDIMNMDLKRREKLIWEVVKVGEDM